MSLVPPAQRRLPAAGRLLAGLAAVSVVATAAWAQPPAPAPNTAPGPAPTAPDGFEACGYCHETTAGAKPSLGPNLYGVGTRRAGGLPDYDYSPAMKAYGAQWTSDTLAAFILDPAKTVPGNKMDYPGANDAAAAKAIADYLMSLKG
jgi:cytochrome c